MRLGVVSMGLFDVELRRVLCTCRHPFAPAYTTTGDGESSSSAQAGMLPCWDFGSLSHVKRTNRMAVSLASKACITEQEEEGRGFPQGVQT